MPKEPHSFAHNAFGHEHFDHAGLLYSYAFGADGRLAADDGEPRWRWLGFALTDARARSAIAEIDSLPSEARRCLLENDRRVFMKKAEGWIFGSLPDISHRHYGEGEDLGLINFALNRTMLITARKRPLQTIDDIRREVEGGQCSFPSPATIIDAFVSQLLELLEDRLDDLFEELDNIEDRVIGGRWSGERDRLAPLRRRAIVVHRHLFLVTGLFRPLPTGEIGAVAPEIMPAIENSAARASALLHDSEQVQARALLLQEEIMAQLSERTNKLLYLLSVLTAVLMPATIISGLFGMNLHGIPFSTSHAGFWEAALLSAIGSGAVFLFVRRLGGRD